MNNPKKQEISQFILDDQEYYEDKYIHFAIIDEAMKENGFSWEESDFNGWQHDYWITYSNPDVGEYVYKVAGSWYYPKVTIEKVYHDLSSE